MQNGLLEGSQVPFQFSAPCMTRLPVPSVSPDTISEIFGVTHSNFS
jgi:hypothetical protein